MVNITDLPAACADEWCRIRGMVPGSPQLEEDICQLLDFIEKFTGSADVNVDQPYPKHTGQPSAYQIDVLARQLANVLEPNWWDNPNCSRAIYRALAREAYARIGPQDPAHDKTEKLP